MIRSLLKLSGESLSDEKSNISEQCIKKVCKDIKGLIDREIQVVIVIGGGNFFRGVLGKGFFDSKIADCTGMLATIMNGILLSDYLKNEGIKSQVLSALPISMPEIISFSGQVVSGVENGSFVNASLNENFRNYAIDSLDKGNVVIIVGGTGNAGCTTDTASAIYSKNLDCQYLIKATKQIGVFTADPEKDSNAKLLRKITYKDAIENNYNIMDSQSFEIAMNSNSILMIGSMYPSDSFFKIMGGDGTTVVNS